MPDEKAELEIEKLRLEIKNIKRDNFLFYFPSLASFFAFIASVFSIIYAYNTGFFDNEKRLLEIKKEQLTLDIQKYENRKDSIQIDVIKLKKQINQIQQKYATLSKKYQVQKNTLDNGIKEVNLLISENKMNEAMIKFQDLVDDLNGIKREFSNDFNDDFK